MRLEPVVQRRAQGGVPSRQQHRQVVQALRKAVALGLADQHGRPVPLDRRVDEPLAGQAQIRVARCGLTGQHQVQVMQRQFAQQLLELSLVADKPKVGCAQHGLQQRMGGQLGDAVGEPDRQARHLAAGRFAHFVGDALAQLKDLLGARERGLARLGEGHATT